MNEITQLLETAGCLWQHPNPTKYHAKLVSGLYSNGYVNMRNIYTTSFGTQSLNVIMAILASRLSTCQLDSDKYIVVGSAYGGVIPSYLLALHLGLASAWTEKLDDNSQDTKFNFSGKYVILVEDVLTTGSTTHKSIKAIESASGIVPKHGSIVCIVNRTGSDNLGNYPIISGINLSIDNYDPDTCPWCTQGSLALKPKIGDNWRRLSENPEV